MRAEKYIWNEKFLGLIQQSIRHNRRKKIKEIEDIAITKKNDGEKKWTLPWWPRAISSSLTYIYWNLRREEIEGRWNSRNYSKFSECDEKYKNHKCKKPKTQAK